jgi:hypothetical protein
VRAAEPWRAEPQSAQLRGAEPDWTRCRPALLSKSPCHHVNSLIPSRRAPGRVAARRTSLSALITLSIELSAQSMRAHQKNAPARAMPQARFANSLLLPVRVTHLAPLIQISSQRRARFRLPSPHKQRGGAFALSRRMAGGRSGNRGCRAPYGLVTAPLTGTFGQSDAMIMMIFRFTAI